MKNSNSFPIIDVTDNRVTAIDGNIAYFYKLIAPDHMQMNEIESYRHFSLLLNELNSCDSNYYYKFYHLEGEIYLETNSSQINQFSGMDLVPCDNPLSVFFNNIPVHHALPSTKVI